MSMTARYEIDWEKPGHTMYKVMEQPEEFNTGAIKEDHVAVTDKADCALICSSGTGCKRFYVTDQMICILVYTNY